MLDDRDSIPAEFYSDAAPEDHHCDIPHPADLADHEDTQQHAAVIDLFDDGMRDDHKDTGPTCPIELIDWATINEQEDEIVPGLIIPGRWTAIGAPAKQGKTTLLMAVTVAISEGRDPFDGNEVTPAVVLYVDAEMGRFDIAERLDDLGYEPDRLTRWHATDMPPKLDTVEGGVALQVAARQLGATVVVIDGINGTVTGAEKDDTTWRAFFEHAIQPLKRAGIAVVTGDNYGKDESLGPRGSSVKVDKADAVIKLKRSDRGVTLTTTHRRTSAFPLRTVLAVDGLDGDESISYRHTESAWPAGTELLVKQLDGLGLPADLGRVKARQALKAAGIPARNDTICAALRYRKLHPSATSIVAGDRP